MRIRKVLVTGGLGYIGSHSCVELIKAGYEVVCADNLANSSAQVLSGIEALAGSRPEFHAIDLCDKEASRELILSGAYDAVIHFAGLKAVGESVEQPVAYYENNLLSLINVVQAMKEAGTRNLVFSSSATVYAPSDFALAEDAPLLPPNPYGRTKLFIEEILTDLYHSDTAWNISLLRYFNPVGAHPSGLIGENPNGRPNNLMPLIVKVAAGDMDTLQIFGNDYPTRDGTGVRDFIHVVDLACGHLAALNKLNESPGMMLHNIGTGKSTSVLELIHTFERVNKVKVSYEFADRRAGDMPTSFACVDKAKKELGWKAKFPIDDMVKDAWNWAQRSRSV